jgi:hypothetical protein
MEEEIAQQAARRAADTTQEKRKYPKLPLP